MTTYSITVDNWFDAEVMTGVALILNDDTGMLWENYQGPSCFAVNSICVSLLPLGNANGYLSGLLDGERDGWRKNIALLRKLADAIEIGLQSTDDNQ